MLTSPQRLAAAAAAARSSAPTRRPPTVEEVLSRAREALADASGHRAACCHGGGELQRGRQDLGRAERAWAVSQDSGQALHLARLAVAHVARAHALAVQAGATSPA
ncbi:MAG: hypothetical protein ACOZJX_15195 [Pseudomonadota bacterium]